MANYNLSLPAETIDSLLLWLDDKQDVIIKQTDLLSGTGQSTTATMTQKAITDALGTKADASSVYTKTQTDDLLNAKADKSTTYTKTETDTLLNNKVDKETGKGLSTNDYTDADKTKLGALPTAAELDSELAVLAGEAGLAEAVIDTDNAGTEQEFTFRKSGGDGGAYYRKIKGKTIVVDAQLASNDAEAVETTGVNQWDEEWEVVGSQLQSKNLIPVFPNTAYYITMLSYPSHYHNKIFYNAEWEEIGRDTSDAQSFTTPADCAYMRFLLNSGYGTAYNHDICINLSNPAINGQYFPYWKRDLQLNITTRKDTDGNVPFADGMKGAGTASDWADKIGGEKRMVRVNLGDLTWEKNPNNIFYSDDAIVSQFKPTSGVNTAAKMICSRFLTIAWQSVIDQNNGIGFYTAPNSLVVYDASMASMTAAQFKEAVDGVYLDIELATPVPFTWAEPLNLGVKVDENGTEKAVAPEGATAPSAPFVADTTYTMSVARMVEILKNL